MGLNICVWSFVMNKSVSPIPSSKLPNCSDENKKIKKKHTLVLREAHLERLAGVIRGEIETELLNGESSGDFPAIRNADLQRNPVVDHVGVAELSHAVRVIR